MTKPLSVFFALVSTAVAVGASTPAVAQGIHGTAISGAATNGFYCLTGNAANIHSLGWVEARTAYRITFDADFALTTAITRFNMAAESSSIARGAPEFNATASTTGMMVLHVASNGQSGCYRFQATLTAPAAQVTAARAAVELPDGIFTTRSRPAGTAAPYAISGAPSSGIHCVFSANPIPQVHEIGRVDAPATVNIPFDVSAGFEPFIGATLTSLEPDAGPGSWVLDTGTPGFSFTAEAGENVVLYVAARSGVGCYRYKVELR